MPVPADGRAALFGFVGVPAPARAQAGEAAVVAAALRQLGHLFGPEATRPLAAHYKDWAADALTATPDDQDAGGHPQPPRRPWVEGEWADRLTLIGAETSCTEPGYLAGAHEAPPNVAWKHFWPALRRHRPERRGTRSVFMPLPLLRLRRYVRRKLRGAEHGT
jgi:monoamine oxidase